MSNSILPHLVSESYVTRRPVWSTEVAKSSSGNETRIPNYAYALNEFDLHYDFLGQGANNNTDWATLEGFYEARLGSWDSFLFDDQTDNQTPAPLGTQVIATGDGATKAFQLVRTLGPNTAPVYAINGVAANLEILWKPTGLVQTPPINIYLAGVLQGSGYTIGTLPVLSLTLTSAGSGGTDGSYSLGFTGGAGGSGAAGTYTITGGIVTAIVLSSGGSGYIYPPIPTFPSGSIVGAYAYASIGNGGTLLFSSAPGSSVVITADFAFFYRVRFSDDRLEFRNLATGYWEAGKVSLQQVRQ